MAGDGSGLYGAITTMDLSQALEKEGYHVDKKQIQLKTTIKSLGRYEAELKLHRTVSVSIAVEVQAQD